MQQLKIIKKNFSGAVKAEKLHSVFEESDFYEITRQPINSSIVCFD